MSRETSVHKTGRNNRLNHKLYVIRDGFVSYLFICVNSEFLSQKSFSLFVFTLVNISLNSLD